MRLDATDIDALNALASEQSFDVLVHVVGISAPGGAIEIDPQDWSRVFDVNLRSAYLAAKSVLPGMIKQGHGALVFVSSIAAVYTSGYSYAAYEASKAGLNRFARSLAYAHAAQGIRSNVVMPGMIDTPHVKSFITGPQTTSLEERAEIVPMKRQGSPWEVAQAIAFLASDQALYHRCLPSC